MKRAALVACVLVSGAMPAAAAPLWLVIAATDPSPAAIAEKGKPFSKQFPDGFVAQSTDWGSESNSFVWITAAENSPDAAEAALPRAQATVKEAFVKRCEAKPGSLLALRISAVDVSIADVPKDAVNWSDEDRVSTVQTLPDQRSLAIIKYFTNAPEDYLEGRRQRVLLIDAAGKRTVLEPACTGAGAVVTEQGRIAFQCAREQAGEHLLHALVVFDHAGGKIGEFNHCRNPAWLNETNLECQSEFVDAQGHLNLEKQRFSLPR